MGNRKLCALNLDGETDRRGSKAPHRLFFSERDSFGPQRWQSGMDSLAVTLAPYHGWANSLSVTWAANAFGAPGVKALCDAVALHLAEDDPSTGGLVRLGYHGHKVDR